jgi:hypothetical protein
LIVQARHDFGFQVRLSTPVREQAIENPTGDVLDAVLAAVQAAWSANHQYPPAGIPKDCDSVEGWIVDPSLLDSAGKAVCRALAKTTALTAAATA